MNRLGAPRPLLKRPVRRSAERIERDRIEVARKRVDDATAEAVERMAYAVARLGAGGEGVPAGAAGQADEDDRPHARNRPFPLAIGETEGAARDEPDTFDC